MLVIPGDFTVGMEHATLLEELTKRFKAVVFVCGNHEYYDHDIQVVDSLYSEMDKEIENFHFLQGSSVIINKVRFIGGTFWTDCRNQDPLVMMRMKREINDFSRIHNSGKLFTPEDSVEINSRQRLFFMKETFREFDGETIIVSHHAPDMICSDRQFGQDESSYAFCNTRLEGFLESGTFGHWLHGHVHHSVDEMIDLNDKKVRILCNPRGYVGHSLNPDFDTEFFFEV